MSRNTYTLSLNQGDQALLSQKAEKLGFLRGDKPNSTELVRALARGELPLADVLSPDLQRVLTEQLWQIKDFQDSVLLAKYLQKREDLLPEFLELTDLFFDSLRESWVPTVASFIEAKQPFQLFYTDAAGTPFSFNVRFAKFTHRNLRTYLDCWCEETEGNQDLSGLQHNWSFRPDRVGSAGAVAIEKPWRSEELDTIGAEFHLYGGLAYAYEPRADDLGQEWISGDPPTLAVVRSITSSFWFKREILPYGKSCLVVGPEELRQGIKGEIENLVKLYG